MGPHGGVFAAGPLCSAFGPGPMRRRWVEETKAVYRVGSDLAKLSKCGLVVDFSSPVFSQMGADDPRYHLERQKMENLWKLVVNAIRSKATAMMRHRYGFPESLAGMLDEDREQSVASLQRFKLVVEAFRAAQARQEPAVRELVSRSQLSSAAMELVMRYAGAASFTMGPQLVEWLRAAFHGILQSIISENCNKELRDCETRRGPSKSLGKMEKWNAPVDSQLLSKFKREEISIVASAPVPSQFGKDNLFEPVRDGTGASDSMDLRRITGKQDWSTYNTVGAANMYGDVEAMLWAHQEDAWQQLGRSWASQLIPENQVVCQRDKSLFVLVLKCVPGACLVWPMKKRFPDRAGYYCLDLTVDRLQMQAVMSFEGWFVLDCRPCSPLELFKFGAGFHDGITFRKVGMPTPLLEWQASHGFAGVPEHTLKKLSAEMGASEGDFGETTNCKYDDLLALRLMMVVRPELTREQALNILLMRNLEADLDASGYIDDITDDQWADCALLADQKDSKDIISKRKAAGARRTQAVMSAKKLVETSFPQASKLAKRVAGKNATKKAADMEKQARSRFFEAVASDVNTALVERLPGPTKLVTDVPNGRWLVS